MVYTDFVRRTSSRLLSSPGCRLQHHAIGVLSQQSSTAVDTIHRPISSLASSAIVATRRNIVEEFSTFYNGTITATRSKHSSTQIKRLFKQNPAKRRIALKQPTNASDEGVIPESTIQPLVADPKFLTNGWNALIGGSAEQTATAAAAEGYPFQVARTKNKPNNALGFLPVYSEHR